MNQTSNGKSLAILLDVQEHLHERVLHRLVGVGRVAQILERDPDRPPLQQRHQRAEPLPRRVTIAGFDQRLDLGGQHRGRRRMRGIGRTGLPFDGDDRRWAVLPLFTGVALPSFTPW